MLLISSIVYADFIDCLSQVDAKYAPHAYFTQDDVLLVPCVANKYNATYINTHGLTLDQASQVLNRRTIQGWPINIQVFDSFFPTSDY